MENRNAPCGTPPWAPLAYRLWRRRHMTWTQLAALLRSEGYEVYADQVQDVVLDHVAAVLDARYGPENGS